MKTYAAAIALIGTLLLGACMPFGSSQPAPAIYALHSPSPAGQQAKKNNPRIIAIQEPEVPVGFDTDKIALYLYNKRRLDYYKNAVWPEHLGKVIQEVIIQYAQSLPDTMAVAANAGFPATEELWIKVNDFEPVYTAGPAAPPQLKVSLSFRLISPANRKVLLEATYSATARAAENTQTAIVSGLEALLLRVDRKAFREISPQLQRP